eukprot:m.132824 g.132824  ORF g.132824 m.132824 type:complete len:249 (-) comp11342_c0_seq1:264-1010(-)
MPVARDDRFKGTYDYEGENNDDDDVALLGLDGTPLTRAIADSLVVDETEGSDGGQSAAAHATRKRNKKVLIVASVTFFLFAVAEVLGGILGNSLALASDAATMIVDAVTYVLNLYAEHKKAKTSERGVLLYELISPTFSVVALIATTIYILIEAIQDLHPDSNSSDDSPNIVVMWFFTLLNLTIDIVNIFSLSENGVANLRGQGGYQGMGLPCPHPTPTCCRHSHTLPSIPCGRSQSSLRSWPTNFWA